MATDPIVTAAAKLAAEDAAVKGAMRDLVLNAIDQAQYLMAHGSMPNRMTLIKALIPAMVKEMAKAEEEDTSQHLRDKMEEVLAQVRGDTAPVEMDDDDGDDE